MALLRRVTATRHHEAATRVGGAHRHMEDILAIIDNELHLLRSLIRGTRALEPQDGDAVHVLRLHLRSNGHVIWPRNGHALRLPSRGSAVV